MTPLSIFSRRPSNPGVITCLLLGSLLCHGMERYEEPPISYSEGAPDNRVSRLFAEPTPEQTTRWKGLSEQEFVRALLQTLEIPEASQVLVFSKTSLQNARIHPRTPRALYFNDTCYLGWVPGGDVEIAVQDATLGIVFYRLTPPRGEQAPQLVRTTECLRCHATTHTARIPGVLIRSVSPDANGQPLLAAGTVHVGHETPLEQRWGGWYVTGPQSHVGHMGNRTAHKDAAGQVALADHPDRHFTDLSDLFPTAPYLSAHSDIVALMIFEHQVNMHNLLNHAAYELRRAHHRQAVMEELLQGPSDTAAASMQRVIQSEADQIVAYLLFKGEADLPGDGIDGDPAFLEAFGRGAPTASDGRGLRDLELVRRMFKHRCSYMIYSPAFTGLPIEIRQAVYARLGTILSATEPEPAYAYLSTVERSRILAILKETLNDLPDAWPAAPAHPAP